MGRPMQTLQDILGAAAIGVMGGVANFAYGLQHGKAFSWLMLITSIIVSGVVGVVIYWLCVGFHLDPNLCAAGAGVGGLLGTRAVDILEGTIRKQLGVEDDSSRHP